MGHLRVKWQPKFSPMNCALNQYDGNRMLKLSLLEVIIDTVLIVKYLDKTYSNHFYCSVYANISIARAKYN